MPSNKRIFFFLFWTLFLWSTWFNVFSMANLENPDRSEWRKIYLFLYSSVSARGSEQKLQDKYNSDWTERDWSRKIVRTRQNFSIFWDQIDHSSDVIEDWFSCVIKIFSDIKMWNIFAECWRCVGTVCVCVLCPFLFSASLVECSSGWWSPVPFRLWSTPDNRDQSWEIFQQWILPQQHDNTIIMDLGYQYEKGKK